TPAYTLMHGVDLRRRNTFGVAARAPLLAEVHSVDALPALFADPRFQPQGAMALGGGSNLLLVADPTVALVSLGAAAMQVVGEDGERVIVRAEAGANWHAFVMWSL